MQQTAEATTAQPRRPLPCAVTDRRMAGGHGVNGVAVAELASRAGRRRAASAIVRETSSLMGVPAHLVFSDSVARPVVAARHAAILRIRGEAHLSYTEIADALGLDYAAVARVVQRSKWRDGSNTRAEASHRKAVARDFIDNPRQLRWLFNGSHVSLSGERIIDRLQHLRLCELNRIPHERRRDPTARRVPAEQRIDDIDAALLAARYVRRFGHGH